MIDANDLITLTESAAMVERMVLARLKIISEGPTPELPVLSEYVDMIARLTSIRKSLATLESNPCNAPHNPQSPILNRQFPQNPQSSPNRQSSIVNRQSIHQVHQVRTIPAMPVARIASELEAITKELESSNAAESTNAPKVSEPSPRSSLTPPASPTPSRLLQTKTCVHAAPVAASLSVPACAPNAAARPFKFRKKRKRR